jgi:hypothetical protein
MFCWYHGLGVVVLRLLCKLMGEWRGGIVPLDRGERSISLVNSGEIAQGTFRMLII